MFTQMMKELANYMNFTLNFMYSNTYYGSWNKTNNKWSGVFGRLQSREIDVAISENTITKERTLDFDFACPLVLTRTRIFIKIPGSTSVQWNVYLKVYL